VLQPEDAEDTEPLELETLEIAVDDDAEPDVDPEEEIDVEPDDPDANPQLREIFSHLPDTGFGDVPAGPFFAHLSGVPPGSQAAHFDPLHL
jgi:hypothetical protein